MSNVLDFKSNRITVAGLEVRCVVLRCPYLNFENSEVRDLFSKMAHLKRKGYGSRHDFGSLPLDSTDFVADHPLICVVMPDGSLEPISGSKVITHAASKMFHLDFAMQSCFNKIHSDVHSKTLETILDSGVRNNTTVAYHGGYTIDTKLVTESEREKVRELFMALTVNYFQESGITELLGLGVPKFKTENFFYAWGYERCRTATGELPDFPLYFLPNTQGVMMHLKSFSQGALELAKRYRSIWDNRIELGENAESFRRKSENQAA